MGYKITKRMEVWRKVGEEDQVIQEYNYGSYICPEFAFLWNNNLDKKKAIKILRILCGLEPKKKQDKKVGKKHTKEMK